MQNIILERALSTVYELNKKTLVAVINATGNPLNAALMLLEEYVAPELSKHASFELHKNYVEKGVSISNLFLVNYNPLGNPDSAITYTGIKTKTIFLKEGDTIGLSKWKEGYRNSNVDYRMEEEGEYTWKQEFTESIGNCYCSLTRWQEFMLRDAEYTIEERQEKGGTNVQIL